MRRQLAACPIPYVEVGLMTFSRGNARDLYGGKAKGRDVVERQHTSAAHLLSFVVR